MRHCASDRLLAFARQDGAQASEMARDPVASDVADVLANGRGGNGPAERCPCPAPSPGGRCDCARPDRAGLAHPAGCAARCARCLPLAPRAEGAGPQGPGPRVAGRPPARRRRAAAGRQGAGPAGPPVAETGVLERRVARRRAAEERRERIEDLVRRRAWAEEEGRLRVREAEERRHAEARRREEERRHELAMSDCYGICLRLALKDLGLPLGGGWRARPSSRSSTATGRPHRTVPRGGGRRRACTRWCGPSATRPGPTATSSRTGDGGCPSTCRAAFGRGDQTPAGRRLRRPSRPPDTAELSGVCAGAPQGRRSGEVGI